MTALAVFGLFFESLRHLADGYGPVKVEQPLWLQLGVGGIFALLLIEKAFAWSLKFSRRNSNYRGVNDEVLKNSILSAASMERLERDIERQSEEMSKQTKLLENLAATSEAQKELLVKIADNAVHIGAK